MLSLQNFTAVSSVVAAAINSVLFSSRSEHRRSPRPRSPSAECSCVTGTSVHEVLCLVIVNVTKYVPQKNVKDIKFVVLRCVLSRSKCTKTRFRLGAYDAVPDPLVG